MKRLIAEQEVRAYVILVLSVLSHEHCTDIVARCLRREAVVKSKQGCKGSRTLSLSRGYAAIVRSGQVSTDDPS